MTTETITVRVEGKYADILLEHVINPALKDYSCRVEWPGFPPDPTITVTFDPEELRELIRGGP